MADLPPQMPHRVALFATCIADLAAPGPARSAVEVLEALGAEVVFPAAQTCCGQPALTSGFPDSALVLARRWIRLFEPYPMIVAPSGSCTAMVHHHYPRLLTGRWRRRAEAVAARTVEFTQFVAAYGADRPLWLAPTTVTYHDSCHMLRSLGEAASPRAVLERVGGVDLVEMTDSDTCCGFGGTFSVKLGEIAEGMADQKLASARDTGSDRLVSADGGCLVHLRGRSDATGAGVRTCHVADLVAAALQTGAAEATR